MRTGLGKLEAALFAYAQMRGLRLLRSGDLRGPLQITVRQEQALLTRMAGRGLIAQVRRGLYLVPPRLPLGGQWTPDEADALATIMRDKGAKYQITGPNAFQRYGYDEQIPARVYAYNDKISGDRKVGQVSLVLMKVSPSRLGDTKTITTSEGTDLIYASRARTLMDAVYDWSRFDSLPRAFEWIRGDVGEGRVTAEELVRVALRYGNQGTLRRMGAILQDLSARPLLLKRLERAIRSSASKIPLVPGRSGRGAFDSRWGVIRNG